MKMIGILGGIGPQATMDLETRIHRAAQRLIPPKFNAGYPPMVVWYCRHAPIIVGEDGKAVLPLRPDPRLLEAARSLGPLVDFLIICSNGAHVLQSDIERASGRDVLSIIETTLREVDRRGWKKLGVLGLGEPKVYLDPLRKRGLTCETIDGDRRAALDKAIFAVMEGRNDPAMTAAAEDAIAELRSRNVDGIILGCTEIPMLVPENTKMPDLLNPLVYLAEAAVERALM
jgi:aspartate racemase